jgi:hypothetical protein
MISKGLPEAEKITDLAIGGRAGDVGNVNSRSRHGGLMFKSVSL